MRGNNPKTYVPRTPPASSLHELASWVFEEFRRLYGSTQSEDNSGASGCDCDDRYYTETESDALFSPVGHIHDDRYLTDAEISASFSAIGHTHTGVYSPVGHNHTGVYSPVSHTHDDRYFTESESDARYSLISHAHSNYVQKTGDVMTGALTINATATNYFTVQNSSATGSHVRALPGLLRIGQTSTSNPSLTFSKNNVDEASVSWNSTENAIVNYVVGSNIVQQWRTDNSVRLYFSNTANYGMLWMPGGQVYIWNNGTVIWDAGVSASDESLKSNVRPIANPLDIVNGIRGVRFEWNSKMPEAMNGKSAIGVIAQEVEKVLPEVVNTHTGLDGDNSTKTVEYDKLTAVLIEAVKELSARLETLEKEYAKLAKSSA